MKNMNISCFCAAAEQIPGAGEDGFAFYVDNNFGYAAVFDGCGGMGAQKYPPLKNISGARIASQLAAYLTDSFFQSGMFRFDPESTEEFCREMTAGFRLAKKMLSDPDEEPLFSGRMYKELPTTVALSVIDLEREKGICDFIWAGDSRGYYLDQKGLCQVTDDDVYTKEDAFDNLRNDSVLSNVINADTDFTFHSRIIGVDRPMLIINSTDGGFGYFTTPMEFEYLILHTLFGASDLDSWRTGICEYIGEAAGDDYTVSIILCGFETLDDCRSYFKERYNKMSAMMKKAEDSEEHDLRRLWDIYKKNYYRN